MKNKFFFVLSLCVTFCYLNSYKAQTYIKNELIIKFLTATADPVIRNGIVSFESSGVDVLNDKFKCVNVRKISRNINNLRAQLTYLLKFKDSINVREVALEYLNVDNIEFAHPNYILDLQGGEVIPNDAFFNYQWDMDNPGIFTDINAKKGADIKMTQAWEVEQGDTSVIVGIIDTGCKLDHPELAGRIWINYGEIPNNLIDDDGNGYIDDVKGWNFVGNGNNPVDNQGHGTNLAGIVGANGNNKVGFSGVDLHCKLMICKILNGSNGGDLFTTAEAIYYAVDNGANVLNMSFGVALEEGDLDHPQVTALSEAIDYCYQHNVVVVAAAGNDNKEKILYPAAFPHTISVGSTNANDRRTTLFCTGVGGSNYGKELDVVAPGNYIFSLSHISDTKYDNYLCGTSQAAPHVSGLASLLIAQDKNRTVDQIRSIIEGSADDQVGGPEDTPGWDKYYGNGRINAYKALTFGETGLSTHIFFEKAKIYPNPFTEYLYIDLSAPLLLESVTIILRDVFGNIVFDTSIAINQVKEQDLSSLSSGLYFLTIKTSEGSITKKIIKQ